MFYFIISPSDSISCPIYSSTPISFDSYKSFVGIAVLASLLINIRPRIGVIN